MTAFQMTHAVDAVSKLPPDIGNLRALVLLEND